MVQDKLFALLIHNHPETFESLQQALTTLSVETYSANTCEEAEDLIRKCKPHVIFADLSVWDGSWGYILDLAEKAYVPLNVIVVGTVAESRVYLSVMDRGAFDFIARPFELAPLDFVLRSAAMDARNRREAKARAATV